MSGDEIEAMGRAVLSFGQHAGKTALQVVHQHPAYCVALRQYPPPPPTCSPRQGSMDQRSFVGFMDQCFDGMEALAEVPWKRAEWASHWSDKLLRAYRINMEAWSGHIPSLNRDPLTLIFAHLSSFYHLFHASQVCRSWRAAALLMPSHMRSYLAWAQTQLQFGNKHSGKTFGSVVREDPKWCLWVAKEFRSSAKPEHVQFLRFFAYLKKHPAAKMAVCGEKEMSQDQLQQSPAMHVAVKVFDEDSYAEDSFCVNSSSGEEEEEDSDEVHLADEDDDDDDDDVHSSDSFTPTRHKRPRSISKFNARKDSEAFLDERDDVLLFSDMSSSSSSEIDEEPPSSVSKQFRKVVGEARQSVVKSKRTAVSVSSSASPSRASPVKSKLKKRVDDVVLFDDDL